MNKIKHLINGFCTAFSMYSTIPMPKIEKDSWQEDTVKYSMCFFPFVGVVIAIISYGWYILSVYIGASTNLFATIMMIIPIIISGGLHLDGLIDASDAIFSRRDMKKKHEILKDSNVGAFGVIMCCIFFIVQFGFLSEVYENGRISQIYFTSFILSRIMSAYAIVTFQTAKNSGLAHFFSKNAQKTTVELCMLMYFMILNSFLIWNYSIMMVIVLAVVFVLFFMFKRICYKEFGGITGDLAGCFLKWLETSILVTIAIGDMFRNL